MDSGFVHDMMDALTAEPYLVQAHVWPSMKTELLHNVVVVLSVNSDAVIHASCEPCRAAVAMWWPFCFLSLTTFKSTGRFLQECVEQG